MEAVLRPVLDLKALAAVVVDLGHCKQGTHLVFWVRLWFVAEIQAEARNWLGLLILEVARDQQLVVEDRLLAVQHLGKGHGQAQSHDRLVVRKEDSYGQVPRSIRGGPFQELAMR